MLAARLAAATPSRAASPLPARPLPAKSYSGAGHAGYGHGMGDFGGLRGPGFEGLGGGGLGRAVGHTGGALYWTGTAQHTQPSTHAAVLDPSVLARPPPAHAPVPGHVQATDFGWLPRRSDQTASDASTSVTTTSFTLHPQTQLQWEAGGQEQGPTSGEGGGGRQDRHTTAHSPHSFQRLPPAVGMGPLGSWQLDHADPGPSASQAPPAFTPSAPNGHFGRGSDRPWGGGEGGGGGGPSDQHPNVMAGGKRQSWGAVHTIPTTFGGSGGGGGGAGDWGGTGGGWGGRGGHSREGGGGGSEASPARKAAAVATATALAARVRPTGPKCLRLVVRLAGLGPHVPDVYEMPCFSALIPAPCKPPLAHLVHLLEHSPLEQRCCCYISLLSKHLSPLAPPHRCGPNRRRRQLSWPPGGSQRQPFQTLANMHTARG